MAPFNTHFLIAEKLWPELEDGLWKEHYGQFCFGCIAPDVDKLSATLSQKETHFFDRTDDYELMASHRTAAFFRYQADFLSRPFAQLPAEAQAFALGYLCHLAVDEVSKHLWRKETTWQYFDVVSIGVLFAALDETARQNTCDYETISRAICSVEVLDIFPLIPHPDLNSMWQVISSFVQAEDTKGEFFSLFNLVRGLTDKRMKQKAAKFHLEIEQARQQIHFFRLERLVKASLVHSHNRLSALIAGHSEVEPGYPVL